MKKISIFLAAVLLVISCQEKQPVRFTKTSAEITSLKQGITAYEKADWSAWVGQFADTAKIYQNEWNKGLSPEETQKNHETNVANFSSYGFDPDQMVFEQVLDDDGETWVNFWGLWKGTFRASGTSIEVPVHLTAQYVNGKIVEEYGFWDSSKIVAELTAIQAAQAAESEDEAEE